MKAAWGILKDHGIQGGPDSVHVHHSMVGDVMKLVPGFKDAEGDAMTAVEAFRKRPKLLSDWRQFQTEEGARNSQLTLVKARKERFGSTYNMCQRLHTLKKMLKAYVCKRRFKSKFGKVASDLASKAFVRNKFKDRAFWKRQKHIVKVLRPIMRSLRMCDSRTEGKAGLLLPSLMRLEKSVGKHLTAACDSLVGGEAGKKAKEDTLKNIQDRIKEATSDKIHAATAAHPRNMLKLQEDIGEET